MEDIDINIENECPICFDEMIIYIVCKNNHKFCNKCYHKMLKKYKSINCPLCRIKITPKSSNKALLRSILEEKELSNKSLYENYHKAFYTGYDMLLRYRYPVGDPTGQGHTRQGHKFSTGLLFIQMSSIRL